MHVCMYLRVFVTTHICMNVSLCAFALVLLLLFRSGCWFDYITINRRCRYRQPAVIFPYNFLSFLTFLLKLSSSSETDRCLVQLGNLYANEIGKPAHLSKSWLEKGSCLHAPVNFFLNKLKLFINDRSSKF